VLHLHGARLSFPKLHRLVAKGFVDVLQTPFFPVQPFFGGFLQLDGMMDLDIQRCLRNAGPGSILYGIGNPGFQRSSVRHGTLRLRYHLPDGSINSCDERRTQKTEENKKET